MHHALFTESLRGPMNLVGPTPVTQGDFARTLGRVLGRPAFAPVPRVALELLFGGEMTREVLTASQRVVPTRLTGSGFTFAHATLEQQMRFELGG
jgi:NAD dependent epimerase/dehydratase family enzyme